MARKYYGRTAILIPHIGQDDKADWLRIGLDVPEGIDRRKLLRGVRIFLKQKFGIKASNDFVHRCCTIVNQHDVVAEPIVFSSPEEKRDFMDRLVLAIQEEEDNYAAQAGGYSLSEAEATEEAELEVSSLQGEPVTLPTL